MTSLVRSALESFGVIQPTLQPVPDRFSAGAPRHPLTLTAEEGFGFFPAHRGQLLADGRYKILRLLGAGSVSSVFLAQDLTMYATTFNGGVPTYTLYRVPI